MKDTPIESRPREKLLQSGPQALSDAELLALLLRTGLPGLGVLSFAQTLIDQWGGLRGLLHADRSSLLGVKGLGPAKQAELLAVLELARRVLQAQMQERPVFESADAVKDFLRLKLAALEHEVFAVLFLDSQHRLIAYEELFRGSLAQTSVYPREVVKRALAWNAAAVVFTHNHPSGVAEPSRADEHLTHTLRSSLALVDVRVLDHLVVGRDTVVSMAQRGGL